MKTASGPQIQKIHVLLNQLGIADQKREIVFQLTDGRTTSTKKLFMDEAIRLITSLAEYDPRERIKKAIFSLAYKAGLIYGDTEADRKMNTAKLNGFLKERGAVKKALNDMSYDDLIKTHRQFEAFARHAQASADNKRAATAVNALLSEFNIPVLQ
ncbi:MAG: hypothetical protein JST19_20525 [Bacteroidetes bacterium]|nr:hypothetical protein [Bacteroidota bacterium]